MNTRRFRRTSLSFGHSSALAGQLWRQMIKRVSVPLADRSSSVTATTTNEPHRLILFGPASCGECDLSRKTAGCRQLSHRKGRGEVAVVGGGAGDYDPDGARVAGYTEVQKGASTTLRLNMARLIHGIRSVEDSRRLSTALSRLSTKWSAPCSG